MSNLDSNHPYWIDFGEDKIEFKTGGATRLSVDNNGASIEKLLLIKFL